MVKKFTSILVLLLASIQLFAQVTITGKVVDEDGYEIPGVNIYIKGTTIGTISDLDGKYTIEVQVRMLSLFFHQSVMRKKKSQLLVKPPLIFSWRLKPKNWKMLWLSGMVQSKKTT